MARVKNQLMLEQEQEFEQDLSDKEALVEAREGILRGNYALVSLMDTIAFKLPYYDAYAVHLE